MKIATLMQDMGMSQNAFFMIKTLNKLAISNKASPVSFYTNLSSLAVKPYFAVMNAYYYQSFFNGITVAADLESAKIVASSSNRNENYLYLFDLPWLSQNMNYVETIELMKKFKIIARSESHAQNIKNYSGQDSLIIQDWNYDDLLRLINEFRKKH